MEPYDLGPGIRRDERIWELAYDEDHMRDRHEGQLTVSETTDLEARLNQMATGIQSAHENAFQKPW